MASYSTDSSGFRYAPLTKTLLTFVSGASIAVSMLNWKSSLKLLPFTDMKPNQLYRLITNHFFFDSLGELLFGSVLIYNSRVFERQMGTRKYAGFMFSSFFISGLMQLLALIVVPGITRWVPGPYGFIFSFLTQYYFEIPKLYKFTMNLRLFKLNLNDKFFIYLMGFQLFMMDPPTSIYNAICGILAGLAYQSDPLRLKKFKFPSFINNFARKYLLPLVQTQELPASTRAPSVIRSTSSQQAPQQQAARQTTPNNANPNLPPEESITLLTNMGFSRRTVIDALRASNNNVELATDLLLESR